MRGYLVGYDSTGIYRIYHPGTMTLKVSRDVIFSEDEFFGIRQVNVDSNNIFPSEDSENVLRSDNGIDDSSSNTGPDAESNGDSEQSIEDAAPIVHDETPVERPVPTHYYGTRSKSPNRRQRRTIA